MASREDHQQQQQLLRQLEARGEKAHAQMLRKWYHDREMGLIAQDIYAAAR